jgi:hypothetical protein
VNIFHQQKSLKIEFFHFIKNLIFIHGENLEGWRHIFCYDFYLKNCLTNDESYQISNDQRYFGIILNLK